MSDRGYINLIRHLTRTNTTLPLETLQASIAHYLARPPLPIPGSPTVLTATVLGSPYFRPYTYTKLTALSVAFRHAVHLRVRVHQDEAEKDKGTLGLLPSRSVNVVGRVARWCRAVLEGLSGSAAVVRLACVSGLLLGLEDWETRLEVKRKEARVRAKVEEEVVLAIAEVVDMYAREGSGWEKDFSRSVTSKGVEEDPLALVVLLASQCAPFVASERLQALPLQSVIDVLLTTIERSFYNGAFLAGVSMAMNTYDQGKLSISPTSVFAQNIRIIAGSAYISSMASLAKFTAHAITVLVESRRAVGWEAIGRTLVRLQSLTSTVEEDWTRCPLAGIDEERDLADGSIELATATWQILKTLLFTNLMILQAILSAVVFVPAPESPSSSSTPSPNAIALDALKVLSHLSFVMPQFGGVASTSDAGLPELKRAFYMALDVLSASDVEAGRFVQELCRHGDAGVKGKGVESLPRKLVDARKAFVIACVEQLVPVLSEPIIQSQVYPLCHPHLWDPSHRETYESAHSVMLAIFASHAQSANSKQGTNTMGAAFAEKIVPMYAQCLVENSFDGRLSTTQLCMAYAALVRSASSFGYATAASSGRDDVDADSMAWFCIEILLDAIRHARAAPTKATLPYSPERPSSSLSSVHAAEPQDIPTEHLQRLYLTLIATVPSVSLTLLPRLLTEVKAIVVSVSLPSPADDATEHHIEELRAELVGALFRAISQDVGDAEKGYAIRWWYDHREDVVSAKAPARHPVFDGVETSAKPDAPDMLVSRL